MKIQSTSRADQKYLASLIGDLSTAMLTQVEEDGLPSSHPVTPLEMDAAGSFWFFAQRDASFARDDAPSSLVFSNEARSTHVSMSGHCHVVDNRERIQALWTPLAKPWFPQGPQSPNLVLLVFVPEHAEYWSSPHSKVVRLFATAASVMAGRPVGGLGQHGVLQSFSSPPNARQ